MLGFSNWKIFISHSPLVHCQRPFIMFIWKCCCFCLSVGIAPLIWATSLVEWTLAYEYWQFKPSINIVLTSHLGFLTPTAPPYRRYSDSKSSSRLRFPAWRNQHVKNMHTHKTCNIHRHLPKEQETHCYACVQPVFGSLFYQHGVTAAWPASPHCHFRVLTLTALCKSKHGNVV